MYWTSHCSTCICFQNSQENEYSQRVYEDYSCHYFLSCRSSSAIIWCPSHSSRRSHKMKMTRLKNDTGRYNHTVIYLFLCCLVMWTARELLVLYVFKQIWQLYLVKEEKWMHFCMVNSQICPIWDTFYKSTTFDCAK